MFKISFMSHWPHVSEANWDVSDFSTSRLVALSALLLSGVLCNTPPAFRRPKNMDTLIPMFGILNIIYIHIYPAVLTTIRLTIGKMLIMRDARGVNNDSLCLLANYSYDEYGNMQYGKIGLQLGYNGKIMGISLGKSVCIFLHRYGSSHW